MATSPEKPLLNDTSKATILSPDGSVANYPTELLTHEEAKLLREYKKFLDRRGYKEALYCSLCWENNLAHGTDAYVTPNQIGIKCRCRFTFYDGASLF